MFVSRNSHLLYFLRNDSSSRVQPTKWNICWILNPMISRFLSFFCVPQDDFELKTVRRFLQLPPLPPEPPKVEGSTPKSWRSTPQSWRVLLIAIPDSLKDVSGQIRLRPHTTDFPQMVGVVREIPLFQVNLGWWNIINWPDVSSK